MAYTHKRTQQNQFVTIQKFYLSLIGYIYGI